MKKINLLYIIPVAVTAMVLSFASCKKNTPEPTTGEPVAPIDTHCNTMVCLPADVAKFFLPSGIWGDGDGKYTTAAPNSLSPVFSDGAFVNSDVEFTYYVKNAKWGGLSFLNGNSWTSKVKIEPGATHAGFEYKVPAGLVVKFTPLSADGGTERTLTADGTWRSDTIALPASYSDSITIAGALSYAAAAADSGDTFVFNFKNLRYIKK